MLKVRVKIFLEKDGKIVLGKGRATLLSFIDENGSLAESARRMNMSYRHAWGYLKKMEEVLGENVVIRKRGGVKGGKMELTDMGKKMLEEYKSAEWYVRYSMGRPALTVDGIVIYKKGIVLIKRKKEPFKGMYALPGGFVESGETVENAVLREVEEETNLKCKIIKLCGVYSEPTRDPRGHVVSIVFLMRGRGKLLAGDDASDVNVFSLDSLPRCAFDHERIIKDSSEEIRKYLEK